MTMKWWAMLDCHNSTSFQFGERYQHRLYANFQSSPLPSSHYIPFSYFILFLMQHFLYFLMDNCTFNYNIIKNCIWVSHGYKIFNLFTILQYLYVLYFMLNTFIYYLYLANLVNIQVTSAVQQPFSFCDFFVGIQSKKKHENFEKASQLNEGLTNSNIE